MGGWRRVRTLVMSGLRLLRHVLASRWGTRFKFTPATLRAIEAGLQRAAETHRGDIRFVIETALHPIEVWRQRTARARALELFATLGVWDTELNNGVLVYVQLADRAVEIIADRALAERVKEHEWASVCRLMGQHFAARRYATGALAGIDAVGTLLARHYPAGQDRSAAPAAAASPRSSGSPAAPVAAREQLLDQPFLL